MDYQRLYEYRFREIDQQARDEVWSEIAPFIWDRMGRPQTILDPAAGRREFLKSVPAGEKWAVDGSDYEEASTDPSIRAIISPIMDAPLPPNHFEGVFVSNFLEHLPNQDAISDFLIRMREVMKENGQIAILGPNYRFCSREYWDFADHHVALTENAVAEHLYTAGFEPQVRIPRFLPYSFRSRLPASARLTSAYLKIPTLWRLFGKQFLVIAKA